MANRSSYVHLGHVLPFEIFYHLLQEISLKCHLTSHHWPCPKRLMLTTYASARYCGSFGFEWNNERKKKFFFFRALSRNLNQRRKPCLLCLWPLKVNLRANAFDSTSIEWRSFSESTKVPVTTASFRRRTMCLLQLQLNLSSEELFFRKALSLPIPNPPEYREHVILCSFQI